MLLRCSNPSPLWATVKVAIGRTHARPPGRKSRNGVVYGLGPRGRRMTFMDFLPLGGLRSLGRPWHPWVLSVARSVIMLVLCFFMRFFFFFHVFYYCTLLLCLANVMTPPNIEIFSFRYNCTLVTQHLTLVRSPPIILHRRNDIAKGMAQLPRSKQYIL